MIYPSQFQELTVHTCCAAYILCTIRPLGLIGKVFGPGYLSVDIDSTPSTAQSSDGEHQVFPLR